MKRKIAVVVLSRANYARIKYVMKAIQDHPDLELELIVGASTLIYRYGKVIDVIRKDGFLPKRSIYYLVEGETLSTQVKSTGLGMIELATAFEDIKPDAVITVADRYETLATAVAAAYQNICLLHVQGGEVSGNIDNKVRHAVTQLADYHFPSTEQSRKRIISMGRPAETVFNLGCPAMDTLEHESLLLEGVNLEQYKGTGSLDWNKPYLLVAQHPVTTSYGEGRSQIESTLSALKLFPEYQKIILWPNPDAGSDDVSKGIRVFKEQEDDGTFSYFRNFSPETYAKILANASCLVGNSSSFIREGSFLGIPAVLVGDRQNNREHGQNVLFATHQSSDIVKKIKKQLIVGSYSSDHLFGNGHAGKAIADQVAKLLK